MMGNIATCAAAAFLISLLMTPILSRAFSRWRLVDAPDGGRKLHPVAVPRIGGIAIAFGYLIALSIPAYGRGLAGGWPEGGRPLIGLVLGAVAVFLTGVLDDLFGLKPWQKLTGQLAAAVILCAAGIEILSLGGRPLPHWIGFPLTVVWIAACTNAFNLIDGLDGLAAGMGLVATLTMFAAALLDGNSALALATLPLAASLAGFLVYNFNPASVFLGDSGSLLVGYLLGGYAIIWSQKSATLIGMAAPLMALAIPLLDVCLSIARRWLRGDPIWRGDRSHIHHKLLERGLTHRRVVLLLYGLAGVCAVVALLQSIAPVGVAILISILFSAAALLGVEKLGYLEFDGARKALSAESLRRTIRGEMAIGGLERRVKSAESVEACWEALRQASLQMGFSRIEALLDGRVFLEVSPGGNGPGWQLRVPLGESGYVQVGRQLVGPEPAVLVPFVDSLRTCFLPRLRMISEWDHGRPQDREARLFRLSQRPVVNKEPDGVTR